MDPAGSAKKNIDIVGGPKPAEAKSSAVPRSAEANSDLAVNGAAKPSTSVEPKTQTQAKPLAPLHETPVATGLNALPETHSWSSASAGAPQAPQLDHPESVASFGMQSPAAGAAGSAAKPKKSKKGILTGALVALFMLGGGAGYYFLQYLPNTPVNVYRRGMASIGVGLEEILLAQPNVEQILETTEFDVKLNIDNPNIAINANGLFGADGQGSGIGTYKTDTMEVSADVRTVLEEGSTLPNIYFKLDGVTSVLDDLDPAAFEGQDVAGIIASLESWQLVDITELLGETTDLDELSSSVDSSQLTQQQYQDILKAVLESVNKYVFTSETRDMVFGIEEVLEKEEFEGEMSQKYLVKVNKDNLQLHVEDLIARLKVATTDIESFKDVDWPTSEEITEEIERVKFDDVRIEAWVDLDTKVLRNLRFSDVQQASDKNYFEVSVLAKDIDVIPVRIKTVSEDTGELEFTLTYNAAQNRTNVNLSADIDFLGTGSSLKVSLTGEFIASDRSAVPEIPEGATPIFETLSQLGGLLGASANPFSASDTEAGQSFELENLQRYNDAATISALMAEYYINNTGSLPDEIGTTEGTGVLNIGTADLLYYSASNISIETTPPTSLDKLSVLKGFVCDETQPSTYSAGSSRSYVVLFFETNSFTGLDELSCLD